MWDVAIPEHADNVAALAVLFLTQREQHCYRITVIFMGFVIMDLTQL